MNQTELIARVRRNCFIPTNHPTYPDQIILDELNDAMRQIYSDLVTIPRQGHWLKQYVFNSTVGQSLTRITSRAVVGGVEKVEIGNLNDRLSALDQVTENHAQLYESFGGTTGVPLYYCIRGDQIEFLPAFNSIMTVRVTYYVKPSKLVVAQSSPFTAGVIAAGGVNAAARQVTVLAVPTCKDPTSPNFNFTLGSTGIADIIHPDGTFELSMVSGTVSLLAGLVYTFAVGTDMTEVAVGDIVRFASETDWPPLPEEFQRTVADVASIPIMLQLNMQAKATALASKVGGDIGRLSTLMNAPRTRRQPKRMQARLMTRGVGSIPSRGFR